MSEDTMSTVSGSIEPLGMIRLRILELFCVMLETSLGALTIDQLIESDGLLTVLKLLVLFPHHSIMQQTVLYFLHLCLRVEPLAVALLSRCGLADFLILKAGEEWAKPQPERNGFSGMLLELTSSLIRAEVVPGVGEFLGEHAAWQTFCDTLYTSYLDEIETSNGL